MNNTRKTILHIEDDTGDHVLFKETMQDHYIVIHAADAYRNTIGNFDCIVTDLSLDHSYGTETVRSVRDLYPGKPLLVLTGLAGAFLTGDVVVKLMNAGADNVASKDILGHAHLIAIIDRLFE